jgi:hypothetical protein
MKKTVLAATAALLAFAAPANAENMDRQIGLIVSGVVDSWAGVQIIDDGFSDDTVFATGGQGLLSLPLGENLSIQSDVKYEYNTNAQEAAFQNNVFGPRYSYQGAAHFSWRDPERGLFGAFGGAGGNSFGDIRHDVRFVGGEAQVYIDDITLYAQGGYVDFNTRGMGPFNSLDEGFFARGVFRWFMANDSRIQLEGTYLDVDYDFFGGMEAFSVGARYDFNIGLPVIGDTPLYVGYRGTFRDGCLPFAQRGGADVDDHVIMIGSSYSFSGDRITVDRQGATLDTPDFNHGCFGQTFAQSDRRLKTDIAALGETADGIQLYSWKYKSDPATTWVGVMAQDLVITHPEALATGADGFYRVNYSTLGVEMMTLEQWDTRQL